MRRFRIRIETPSLMWIFTGATRVMIIDTQSKAKWDMGPHFEIAVKMMEILEAAADHGLLEES